VTSLWSASRLGDLTGSRIIVTGATNGVGLATATALARAGAHVILAVRNLELGAQRAAEMGGDTSVVKLDLADQSSVQAFPSLFDGDVDVLINNAGLVAQHRGDTVDGFEITMGTKTALILSASFGPGARDAFASRSSLTTSACIPAAPTALYR